MLFGKSCGSTPHFCNCDLHVEGFRLPGGFTKDVGVCRRPGRRGEFATDADDVDIRVLDDCFDAYRMHTPSSLHYHDALEADTVLAIGQCHAASFATDLT
jgi:hypothetical protein